MDTPSGKPTIIKGTPPTPENPHPSNQIVEEYPDGHTVIQTPRPTRKVLQEYEQALRQYPENAELHLNYGRALFVVNKDTQALVHMQEAVRLKPDWAHAHAMLGHLLQKRGEASQSMQELEQALHLQRQEDGERPRQGQAILRWSLSKLLRQAGQTEQARQQIEQAVALQQELVNQQQASTQLLRQLKDELAQYSDGV